MIDRQRNSRPLDLQKVHITDAFWHREMELVRQEVLPYQWRALNDQVAGAAKSYCMHNFRAAARLMARRKLEGSGIAAKYTMRGFEQLPESGETPDPDRFYGFVFQDSDLYKWLEAVAYSLMRRPDPALEQTADEVIDTVCAAQAEDGYLDTCYILGGMDKRFTNLRDHHELYCLGHLIEAAVAYHQATGKDKLLRAACRFADLVYERFGAQEGKCHGYPGHEIAEMALVRLYEDTGEPRYLELSNYFINQRGQLPNYFAQEENERRRCAGEPPLPEKPEQYAYHQAHKPVREQEEAVGHAVRAMYLYSGMADVARETGDELLYRACCRLWHSVVDEKMYITGGIGATRHGEAFSIPFDLPNDTAYSETCAAIGLVFFARRMLQIHPEGRVADVMERALYNTVLSGMALDGKSFFYVNPLEVVPEAIRHDERLSHVAPQRQKWFGCACCPPNIARLLSSLGAYVCTASADTLLMHLYVGGDYPCVLGGKPLTLHVKSEMPWRGHADISVEADGVEGTLAFRLPGWSYAPEVVCPGKEAVVQDGYAYLTGVWNTGDYIGVSLPMRMEVVKAHPSVRADVGQVAFTRGPIVFCAEEIDNGPHLHEVFVCPDELCEMSCGEKESNEFGHPTMQLEIPAYRPIHEEGAALYQPWRRSAWQDGKYKLIPYYCWANRGEGEMRVWLHCLPEEMEPAAEEPKDAADVPPEASAPAPSDAPDRSLDNPT